MIAASTLDEPPTAAQLPQMLQQRIRNRRHALLAAQVPPLALCRAQLAACERVGTTSSRVAWAMFRIVASLAAEKPQLSCCSVGVASNCAGLGKSLIG